MLRWFVALGLVAAVAPALANGRKPATNGAFVQPGKNDTILVRTTFGPLLSRDAGCTFRWICENNVGYGGEFDPKYEIAADGTIFATTYKGLRVSRDGACSFTTATEELPPGDPNRIADTFVDGLDLAADGTIWVSTAETGRANDVYRSRDNGMTFEPTGQSSSTIFWKSIESAPSRADTVYVAGYALAPLSAHLVRTDNAGIDWTALPLTGITFGQTPILKVVAVDPATPATVFVAAVNTDTTNGERLYRSTDSGVTFTEVLVTTTPIANLVFDGSRVLVVAGTGGTFSSMDGGVTFVAVPNAPQLACLVKRPDGTFIGCGANWDPDFKAVATSPDGSDWTKVFRFVELAGPVECPAGTPQRDVCDVQQWPNLQEQFASTGSLCGAPPPDGPSTEEPHSGGCCDANATPPIAGFALIVAFVVLRRRRMT